MAERLWAIVDYDGVMRAVGPTEGQAWMRFLYLAGTCFAGQTMLGMLERYRTFGFRAVEMGDRAQSC